MAFAEHIKLEVRRRSHHACCLCKSIGIEIHHVVPQEEEGLDTIENAAPLCPSCHETYGANSTKRKMIIEARDLWYEICAARYKSDEDRISELLREVAFLRKQLVVPDLATAVAEEVVARLIREGVISRQSGDGWPISKLLERIARFQHEFPIQDARAIDATYALIFETEGDLTVDDVVEYNKTRDRFLALFGSFIARNLCAYILHADKIDLVKGVTEPELDRLIVQFLYLMIFLLYHEDIEAGPIRLSLSFDGNDFHAWFRGSKEKLQRDLQQAARS